MIFQDIRSEGILPSNSRQPINTRIEGLLLPFHPKSRLD